MKNLKSNQNNRNMKKIILLIVTAMLLSPSLIAQVTFTLDAHILLKWTEESGRYVETGDWIKDPSMMKLNELETVFNHRTNRMESNYYVKSTEHEEDYRMYYVVSDVGNEYLFMIDIEKRLFKIIDQPDDSNMLIHNIKATF